MVTTTTFDFDGSAVGITVTVHDPEATPVIKPVALTVALVTSDETYVNP
jgi:hypothetical protein